jgi:hypothetical protein
MKSRLFVLLIPAFLILFQAGYGQLHNGAEVISNGGGISSGGVFTNFSTVGEPAVNIIAGGTLVTKIGFIFKLSPDVCPITLYPLHYDFNSAQHLSNTIAVTASTGGDCIWTATVVGSATSWLTIVPGTETSIGSGTVVYNVAQNSSGLIRNGTIEITGIPNQQFTITQYNTLAIPTLPEWGLITLGVLFVFGSGYFIKRSGLI